MLKREELSIIIGSVSIPRRRPQIVLSQLHAYYKLKGRVHIFKKIVVFFSSPRLVDQISPIVDGPRSNIFDHDGRTPEHHSSCQGSRNSKVSPIGEERKKLCHELVNSPFNTFHFFYYLPTSIKASMPGSIVLLKVAKFPQNIVTIDFNYV